MEKPTLPKGTRDFGPAQMAKRQFIFNTIRTVFQKYGFMPLETPAMENLSTLTGKYGEEGDQLLFKVLDSGEYFEKLKKELANSSRIAKIKDALYDCLRSISRDIFKELSVRDFEKINKIFLSVFDRETWIASRQLDAFDKMLFRDFFEIEKDYLSYELQVFYAEAGIHPENFNQKFDHHFRQFRDYTLNNKLLPQLLKFISSKEISKDISEKGLRYDLTVPFARYVVMNRGEITLPFKRYQIQPVWRADRPQKGRYREFYQCDADVVGTDSLVNEAEIILMIQEVFKGLNIQNFTIKINHRGVLSGLAEISGAQNNEGALFVAIDKLDKIGEEKVKEEMKERGISADSAQQVFDILNFKGSNVQKLELLRIKFANSEKGMKGVDDLENVFKIVSGFNASATNNQQSTTNNVEFDISLARGLSYYTGPIFEVKVNNVAIGSVSGGGRYDNLTQAFGAKEKLSGVGISFGIDRLYDVMDELTLFPKEAGQSTKVLITHLDEAAMQYGLSVTQAIRNQGIACEIYPEITKLKKQLDYANKKQILFAVVIGSDEMNTGILTLKNLTTGEQEKLKSEEIINRLK